MLIQIAIWASSVNITVPMFSTPIKLCLLYRRRNSNREALRALDRMAKSHYKGEAVKKCIQYTTRRLSAWPTLHLWLGCFVTLFLDPNRRNVRFFGLVTSFHGLGGYLSEVKSAVLFKKALFWIRIGFSADPDPTF